MACGNLVERGFNKIMTRSCVQRVGSIDHNRGVIMGIVTAEAIRTAQANDGQQPLTGEEVQWGLENLNITPARIRQLGAEGLMSPIKLSCHDHEGGGAVKFQQWDGSTWNVITGWIDSDQSIVRPMIEASAAAYAEEKGIKLRSGPSLGSECP